jgi:hypothetical protein
MAQGNAGAVAARAGHGVRLGATRGRSKHMRLFFLDLLVGIVIGAVGAPIYAECRTAGPQEEVLEEAPAGEK